MYTGGTLKSVRILAGSLLAITLVSVWGSMASAHVTVQPNTYEQGARAKFAVRVPNESATASTIKIELQTPKDSPAAAAGLRVQPTEGWDISLEKTKLDPPIKGETSDITEYVSKVTWTAKEGYKIGPDQFQEFWITTGALPKDKTQLTFKVIQTYDSPLADGATEARWVEERVAGQADPKRPEALVKLTPPTTVAGATATATPAASGDSATESGSAAAATAASDAASSASTAKNIGIIGLILGLIALLVAVGAIVTNKPKTPATTKTSESVDA
jgi:uncharacterized protein YcnI